MCLLAIHGSSSPLCIPHPCVLATTPLLLHPVCILSVVLVCFLCAVCDSETVMSQPTISGGICPLCISITIIMPCSCVVALTIVLFVRSWQGQPTRRQL